jgi:hypothetical protein
VLEIVNLNVEDLGEAVNIWRRRGIDSETVVYSEAEIFESFASIVNVDEHEQVRLSSATWGGVKTKSEQGWVVISEEGVNWISLHRYRLRRHSYALSMISSRWLGLSHD